MISSRRKTRTHKRSASMSNAPGYDDDEFNEPPPQHPTSSSPAKKFVTNVRRTLSQTRQRKRDAEPVSRAVSLCYLQYAEGVDHVQQEAMPPPPYAPSSSHYRYHDPSTVPSTFPPTLEQIAMGLHISRTPHLRTMTVGLRGRGNSSVGRTPNTPDVAQVYYSPYLSQSNGSTIVGTSRSHSRSSSRAHARTPPVQAPPVPILPQRSVSLPPPPQRSSLKRPSSHTPEPTPRSTSTTPGLSNGSVTSASTESSLSTTRSSLRGRSLLNLSLKGRVGWLLPGKGKQAKNSSDTRLAVAYEGDEQIIRKAVRFDERVSVDAQRDSEELAHTTSSTPGTGRS
ncbi:hypothetical protein PC9H_006607 [Pleurotus ostreatus]|uniref:Uncharacterized protein n=1 Tax=Pleurotus ostreatus TaxID=5322 RepID=A0A8H7DVR6_PLEOS|nr:uncharacterized protein PC9H_006607 [Pleurotus ostreatus]KAF7430892.1 hypothetical protein PC9H_006607 [Pleurotus ostreatus]